MVWHWGNYGSGSGPARTFPRPYWQDDIAAITGDRANNGMRAVVDVSVSASGHPCVISWGNKCGSDNWCSYGGTSFASPTFAGLVAIINSYRIANGKPVVGYLNPVLYLDANVRSTFRDVTSGGTSTYNAGTGWDYPSGWGVPNTTALAKAIP